MNFDVSSICFLGEPAEQVTEARHEAALLFASLSIVPWALTKLSGEAADGG
jgi:hypothetical protein